jgi:kumamolisin
MTYQPAHLFSVDVIDPNTGLAPTALAGNGQLNGPSIATAYSIPAATGYGVNIGIFSFGGGIKQTDINSSWADLQSVGLIPSSYTVPTIRQVLLDGQTGSFSGDLNSSSENTVDIFCAATMAPRASITIYIGYNISSMVAQAITDGMHIVTMSWGSSEYTSDETYFQQLASAKIAFLASSGDYGSVVSSGSSSIGVVYPASSPYAIAAGGTKLTVNSSNIRTAESDDNRDAGFPSGWGGGGGISTTFSLPTWQSGRFYTPITNGVQGSPISLTTRGSPDFSAPMNAYQLYFNGTIQSYGGTSLACPTLAGILARYLELTGVKRSSVDWNTFAYANTNAFYDITVGTNNTKITSGYAGTTGWDPVTGLGPPIGTSIYQVLRTSEVFPKKNYGFRPATGAVYPRKTTGAR